MSIGTVGRRILAQIEQLGERDFTYKDLPDTGPSVRQHLIKFRRLGLLRVVKKGAPGIASIFRRGPGFDAAVANGHSTPEQNGDGENARLRREVAKLRELVETLSEYPCCPKCGTNIQNFHAVLQVVRRHSK